MKTSLSLNRIPCLWRAFEVRALLVIFATLCALFAAVLSLDLFSSGATAHLDRTLLLSLRDPRDLSDPLGGTWFEELGRDITALGGFPILTLFTLAVVGFLAFTRHRTLAWVFLATTLLALLLSSGLKAALDRARPDLVPHKTQVHSPSFPSSHAMHSAATYLTLAGLLARFQQRRRLQLFVLAVAVVVVLAVGVSRIYLGVHWPTDVLGGWVFGSGIALLTLLVARLLIVSHETLANDPS